MDSNCSQHSYQSYWQPILRQQKQQQQQQPELPSPAHPPPLPRYPQTLTAFCPFGLVLSSLRPRRYRSPELLLGEAYYTPKVDVWSAGCIVYEMAKWRPVFPGDSAIDQLHRIFHTLGTPREETWPGCRRLPQFSPHFPQWRGQRLQARLGGALPDEGVDLLSSLLRCDPADRSTAAAALAHPFLAAADSCAAAAAPADSRSALANERSAELAVLAERERRRRGMALRRLDPRTRHDQCCFLLTGTVEGTAMQSSPGSLRDPPLCAPCPLPHGVGSGLGV